ASERKNEQRVAMILLVVAIVVLFLWALRSFKMNVDPGCYFALSIPAIDRGPSERYARVRFERFSSRMNLIRYYRFAFTGRFLWRGSGKVEARLRVVA